MTTPELHVNQFGGYFVDMVETTFEGDKKVTRIVETRNFETQLEANQFWFEQMTKSLQEMAGVAR
jgi:TPP-dependent 2-oxoacid decarboxylase